jgi:glycosyltransferase involved in cell wall biosynthesis
MRSPKVSIVIPTYNRADLIGRTLESAINQTFADYEIVVVDDGSTDDTEAVVRRVAPGARYVYQKNVGIPEVMNRCVEHARGEYIQWLGSDDLLLENALAESAAILDAHPSVGLVYGAAWMIDQDDKRLWISRPSFVTGAYIRSGRKEIRDLLVSNHIVAPTVMVRGKAIVAAGGFDSRFGLYEDWNLWTRIARTNDIAYRHDPVTCYRLHFGAGGSVFAGASARDINRYRRMHLDDVLDDPVIGPEFASMKRRLMARHHMVVGNRAAEVDDMWYARAEAIRAAFSHPTAALGAAKLLAKSLMPAGMRKRRRERQEYRGEAAHSQATHAVGVTE